MRQPQVYARLKAAFVTHRAELQAKSAAGKDPRPLLLLLLLLLPFCSFLFLFPPGRPLSPCARAASPRPLGSSATCWAP